MQLNPIGYKKFITAGEIVFEVSEKMLLEKILLQTLGLFSMATEMRFLEKDNKIETIIDNTRTSFDFLN